MIDALNPMKQAISRNMLRFAVQQAIFCPSCQQILDVSNAVSLDLWRGENLLRTFIACGACYDKQRDAVEKTAAAKGLSLEVTDGRDLFGKKG